MLTFVFKNPFGANLKVEAFIKVSENKILVPFQAGRRLSKLDFTAYEEDGKRPWNFTGKLLPPQEELFNKMFPIFTKRGSVSINAFTSWGKTIQSAHLAASVLSGKRGRVVVAFSLKVLVDGWVETFKQFTNARVKIVEKEGDDENSDVLICMISKLKFIKGKIDVLILDEAHLLCTQKILDEFLKIRTQFLIALTATPERDDSMEQVLVALAGGVKHQFVLKYKKPFQIFKLDTGYSEKDCKEIGEEIRAKRDYKDGVEGTRGFLETCLSMHPERNDKISILLCRLAFETNFKIAVMANRTEQIDYLYEELLNSGVSVSRLRGNDKNPENSKILIGDIKKMGVGFDDKMAVKNWDGKRINLVIYLISTYKLEQSIGRSRDPKPYSIHLVDRHKWFNNSYRDNVKWYEEHLTEEGAFRNSGTDPWEDIIETLASENPIGD